MKLSKPEIHLLLLVVFFSIFSLILNITSLATNAWIESKATQELAVKPSVINYGLFNGLLENYLLNNPFKYVISSTCNYVERKCIYSCQTTPEERQNELNKIIRGCSSSNCSLDPCVPNLESRSFHSYLYLKQEQTNFPEVEKILNNFEQPEYVIELIGSGFWFCTVLFLILGIIFSTVSCLFSIINCFWNPINPIFNIFGLYIWNSLAAVFSLLTMIIWGALYETTLKKNVAITDTLRPKDPYNSNGLAKLSYSYFLILPGIVFNFFNNSLLIYRNYLISKTPPPVIYNTNADDTMLTFY